MSGINDVTPSPLRKGPDEGGPSRQRQTIPVGPPDRFPAGQFVMLEIAGRDIGIIQLATGELRAIRNRCPHKGAPICRGIVGGTWPPGTPETLRYDRDGEVLICPWHGWEYDLQTGQELFQPRPTRLLMYPVTIENGQVCITI